MSQRSWMILAATALVAILLVVLLLVPAPEGNAGTIAAVIARLEGALVPLLAATGHTLNTDRKEKKAQDPPTPSGEEVGGR